MTEAFNPLDMHNLGLSITTAMLDTDPTPLGAVPRFQGAGLYAIYYTGDFPAYRLIAERNRDDRFELPIYVGKAIPAGGRKGGLISADPEKPTKGTALSSRLREHAASVEKAINLDIEDFWCRWLVVEPIWIPLGENVLIARTAPVWNRIVDGFGNHDPGSGRHAGEVSRWDVLHPGRAWAQKLKPRRETDTADHIQDDITEYLRSRLE
ncbi:restriction endonuclease Eco29kI [Rhodococcus pyridinivorans KG-16]|uniref:Restriction endonuclease Eco29kI n=2 Tax=Rhodococcus pyridinivorans TaxID=103816 RepID=A0A0V9UD38_9NOCA|nr:restriction endonuclease Eco29kI [Rhodococcus pyridinivorans KG-16]